MFTTLDLILLASDYLGFLLEPIYERMAKRLNFRQNNSTDPAGLYCLEAPWLLRNHKIDVTKTTLEALQLELEAFHEWQRRLKGGDNDLSGGSRAMVELAKRTIETKWPWAALQLAPLDPVNRQLNWMDHDLCLIDDWDFPLLPPSLNGLASDVSGEKDVVATDSTQSNTGIINGRPDVGVNGEGGSWCHSKWCSMRVIYSSSVDRKFFLEIRTSSNNNNNNSIQRRRSLGKTSFHDHHEEKSILCCVKWLTIDEFQCQEARAQLVFYYTQIHPELTSLYHVVSSLLDSAQLIDSAAAYRRQLPSAEPQVDRWSFDEHSSSISSNKQQQQQPNGLLSRYALVLMLAAYLNSDKAKQLRKKGKHLLAQHLIGFLEAYSSVDTDTDPRIGGGECIYIAPKFTGDGSLELSVKRHSQPLDGQLISRLIVLDPIAATIESPATNDSTTTKRPLIASGFHEAQPEQELTNLTKNLRVADRMVKLFAGLRRHLNNIGSASLTSNHNDDDDETASGSPSKSLLATLFTLASSHKLNPQKPPPPPPPSHSAAATALASETALGEPHHDVGSTGDGPFTSTQSYRRNFFTGGFNLSWRKVLTNLLWLSLFLLVRNHLVTYLVRLKADLQEQAREDLLHLKYALYEMPTLQQQRDDHYYGDLNRRIERDNRAASDSGFQAPPSKAAAAAMDLELEKMFGSLMAEASEEKEDPTTAELPNYGANYYDEDEDGEEEDEDDDEEMEDGDDLIENLFASMLLGGSLRGGGDGGNGARPPMDLSKLMNGLNGAGGGGMPDLASLSEMLQGQNLPGGMDMSQMEAMMKSLMADQVAEVDPSTILEDKSDLEDDPSSDERADSDHANKSTEETQKEAHEEL